MAAITTKQIIEATGGRVISDSGASAHERSFKGVSINSRTISDGEIFFAIRGRRFDGHDFLRDALTKGDGAVIDSSPDDYPEGKVLIFVEDTLRALQDLAHFLRLSRDIPVIAITGSNGKTTTKEMTYAILSKKFKVHKNEGNLNNHIGLPLSLSRLAPDDEAIILELGMSASGEIRRLCEIASPTHGIITNIGSAHIGELGGIEAIRAAKLEILPGLSVIALNADDEFLMKGYETLIRDIGFKGRLVTFSINNDSDVRAENIVASGRGSRFRLRTKEGDSVDIALNVFGFFNVHNALAAASVCLSLGISMEAIKAGLDGYEAYPMRFEIIKTADFTLVNDCYNANPASMKESLRELTRMKDRGRTVVILGDMLELGMFSERAHRDLGRMVYEMEVDVFVAVGMQMSFAADECRSALNSTKAGSSLMICTYENSEEAGRNISGLIKKGDVILIKGSRGMSMERVVERIKR